jgi:phosphoglycerol transferase MdoB-like AlkP superfamily enzyme
MYVADNPQKAQAEDKLPEGIAPTVEYRDQLFTLQLVTKDYIFYGDEKESDDNGNTLMYDRNMKLISDNYFANVGLRDEKEANTGIEWASAAFKYWFLQELEAEG